jgi:ATP-binding cassette subfamily F protein 3
VGPNGAGKTTLLATLLGDRKPARGEARLGGSVSAAWFRQDLAQVPRDKTIYDCIADLRPEWTRGRIQNHLGAFGFSGDEVLRNTSVLSGGERARVALALITLARANLLILDEPTNHLDVESIEAVEDALEDYEGTVILVSHDRAFLRELSTRVWAFDGTHLEDYGGPFVEWELHAAERTARRNAAVQVEAAAQRKAAKAEAAKAPERNVESLRRTAERDAAAREKEVHRLEAKVAELESALADPALYGGGAEGTKKAKKIDAELREARRMHDEALNRWTAAVEALSALARS